MKHLHIIKEMKENERNNKKIHFIHLIRFSFFVSLYFFFSMLQISNSHFINSTFNMSAYFSFSIIFLNSSILFMGWNSLYKSDKFNLYLIIFDILSIFSLIQLSGFSPSQFVFIYLGVVTFAGLLLKPQESLFIAALSCLLFNFNVVTISPLSSQLGFLMNNFSLILTSFLASSLSKHLSVINFKIVSQEKEINEVKNINSLIINNMSSGVITTNNLNEVITFNSSAKKLFEDLEIGQNISNHFNIDSSHKNDKGRLEIIQNVDGEKMIIEALQSTLRDDVGEKQGQIFLLQDLTRIKKLEYAARQQDKLAAVGQLAAGIAHEIRNPLASISGSVQLLESTSSDPENGNLYRIILKEIDRLNDLITEFLEFVRPDKVNEEPVELNEMINEIMNMVKFNKQIRQDVNRDIKLKSDRFIHADHSKLKQALLNIILNSYQAMESTKKALISINTFDEEDKVVLQIIDTGNGIKPETLSKIFEPFHTTKAKGTGLGLAITHKILENHNAKVYVESELGKGTQFMIEFPGKGDSKPNETKIKIA